MKRGVAELWMILELGEGDLEEAEHDLVDVDEES